MRSIQVGYDYKLWPSSKRSRKPHFGLFPETILGYWKIVWRKVDATFKYYFISLDRSVVHKVYFLSQVQQRNICFIALKGLV